MLNFWKITPALAFLIVALAYTGTTSLSIADTSDPMERTICVQVPWNEYRDNGSPGQSCIIVDDGAPDSSAQENRRDR